MTIPWSQIAMAVGQTASSLWGANKADTSSDEAFERQWWLQQQQQKFIEHMSNTAHQREVADLKMAGLNPILSAGGSGATTIAGSTPSVAVSNASEHLAKTGKVNEIMNWGLQNKALNLQATKNAYDNEETWQKAQLLASENQTEQLNAQLREQEVIYKQLENQYMPKEVKAKIGNILEDTALKGAQILQTRADKILKQAETKYTNERARGKSRSWSESYENGKDLSVGLQGVKSGDKRGKSSSLSETW